MHESMKRLYEVARNAKIVGQTNLANALNTSPQRVKNWEARGVSKEGLLAAEQIFGCSATYLKTGLYPKVPSDQPPPSANEPSCTSYMDKNVLALIAAVERLSADDAKMLLPVVSRIAESTLSRQPARRNSNNTTLFVEDSSDSSATGT